MCILFHCYCKFSLGLWENMKTCQQLVTLGFLKHCKNCTYPIIKPQLTWWSFGGRHTRHWSPMEEDWSSWQPLPTCDPWSPEGRNQGKQDFHFRRPLERKQKMAIHTDHFNILQMHERPYGRRNTDSDWFKLHWNFDSCSCLARKGAKMWAFSADAIFYVTLKQNCFYHFLWEARTLLSGQISSISYILPPSPFLPLPSLHTQAHI